MILESIGAASPDHGLQMEDRKQVAELFVSGDQRDRWFVETIFEKTTIQNRPSVLLDSSTGDLQERQSFFLPADEYRESAGPTTAERMQAFERHAGLLALEACKDAFSRSEVRPEEITHLVTASCTGFSAPGFDLDLVAQLPLAPTVQRTHLGFMGCHAGFNCLRVADAIASRNANNRVLVCCTELCGLHYQYSGTPDQIVANSLFADGSGAAIVKPGQSESTDQNWNISGNGSYVIPDSAELMKWNIGDNGFTMRLSDRIPDLIKQHAKYWITQWLSEFELSPEQVLTWAVHPGGPQILNAVEIALSLDSKSLQPSRDLLRSRGNMSSASIFFLLKKLRSESRQLPCVAVGFGPGLTIETALFE